MHGSSMHASSLRCGAAPSRGWVAGRLWKPPSPPCWLAGWLAHPRKTAKIRGAPPLLTHGMGMGMGLQGWGGSATFQEHPYLILQVALVIVQLDH